MVYDPHEYQIGRLKSRVKDLEETVASLREKYLASTNNAFVLQLLNNALREKYLYNTSSTMSEDTVNIDWDLDYGQQGID
jgi:hypothetical protein